MATRETVTALENQVEQLHLPDAMLPDFEAVCDRILSGLKLGSQAPGYKAAAKALDRFIVQLQ